MVIKSNEHQICLLIDFTRTLIIQVLLGLGIIGIYYLRSLKNSMDLAPCQKQLECHQHILNEI